MSVHGWCRSRSDRCGPAAASARDAPRTANLPMPVQSLQSLRHVTAKALDQPGRMSSERRSCRVYAGVRRRVAGDALWHRRDVPRGQRRWRDPAEMDPARSCSPRISRGSPCRSPVRHRGLRMAAVLRSRKHPDAAGTPVGPHGRGHADLQRRHGAGFRCVAGHGIEDMQCDRARRRNFDYFFLSDTTDPDVVGRRGTRLPGHARSCGRHGERLLSASVPRTRAARRATLPISSPAGAAPTTTCWFSMPTAS